MLGTQHRPFENRRETRSRPDAGEAGRTVAASLPRPLSWLDLASRRNPDIPPSPRVGGTPATRLDLRAVRCSTTETYGGRPSRRPAHRRLQPPRAISAHRAG